MWRFLVITAVILGTMLPTVASAAPEAQHHGVAVGHGHRGWGHPWGYRGWPGFGPGYGFVAPVVVEAYPVLPPPAVEYVPVLVPVPVAP